MYVNAHCVFWNGEKHFLYVFVDIAASNLKMDLLIMYHFIQPQPISYDQGCTSVLLLSVGQWIVAFPTYQIHHFNYIKFYISISYSSFFIKADPIFDTFHGHS